jgi:hypothetical protein
VQERIWDVAAEGFFESQIRTLASFPMLRHSDVFKVVVGFADDEDALCIQASR